MELLKEEDTIENDIEQSYASEALQNKDFSTYIKVKIHDNLVFLPFDPQNTKIAPNE